MNKNIPFGNYGKCIDETYGVFGELKKLIEDIKHKETAEIILDLANIGMTLFNGIKSCTKKSK